MEEEEDGRERKEKGRTGNLLPKTLISTRLKIRRSNQENIPGKKHQRKTPEKNLKPKTKDIDQQETIRIRRIGKHTKKKPKNQKAKKENDEGGGTDQRKRKRKRWRGRDVPEETEEKKADKRKTKKRETKQKKEKQQKKEPKSTGGKRGLVTSVDGDAGEKMFSSGGKSSIYRNLDLAWHQEISPVDIRRRSWGFPRP